VAKAPFLLGIIAEAVSGLGPLCHNRCMAQVRVYVRLKPALLDTAGRTVETALHRMGWPTVSNMRIGKLIEFEMDGGDEQAVREMCSKLLANPVIEDYSIEVTTP